ncbi:hypothetical protein ABV409_08750 [Flagellimonas sp. DF-77]|uniref:hypothetical protein n=1 Tax=Flagellimonas algarum TaxID=3230298 RepID=UPI0033979F22
MEEEFFEIPADSGLDIDNLEYQKETILQIIDDKIGLPSYSIIENIDVDMSREDCRRVCVTIGGRRYCFCL